FHGFDDLDQADLAGGARQPVTAAGAAEAFQQARLCQRLEDLAHRGGFQPRALGQLGRAQHGFRLRGKHGQHDGGVVGQSGNAEHAEPQIRTEIVLFAGPRLNTPRRPGSVAGAMTVVTADARWPPLQPAPGLPHHGPVPAPRQAPRRTAMHANTDRSSRPLIHALLAGGGLFVLWRMARALGTVFWTIFGLAMAVFWAGVWPRLF